MKSPIYDPCPRCGQKRIDHYQWPTAVGWHHHVECNNCGATFHISRFCHKSFIQDILLEDLNNARYHGIPIRELPENERTRAIEIAMKERESIIGTLLRY